MRDRELTVVTISPVPSMLGRVQCGTSPCRNSPGTLLEPVAREAFASSAMDFQNDAHRTNASCVRRALELTLILCCVGKGRRWEQHRWRIDGMRMATTESYLGGV